MNRKFIHIGDILSARWLINRAYAEAYFPSVLGMIQNQKTEKVEDRLPILQNARLSASNLYEISEYGSAASPENAPQDSIAIIGLVGPVTKYDQFCGNAGTVTKANLLNRAASNPNIKGAILNIDSGGGEGSATELLVDTIKNVIAAGFPVIAMVNGMAASAAYWIASACSEIIICGKTSEVGSIGTYVQFADFTKYYEALGIQLHTIYAPQSTEKNKAFEDVLKGDNKAMLADLSEFTQFFIDAVKENRPVAATSKDKTIFQGAMFYASEAIKNGLADKMGTMTDAVNSIETLSTSITKPQSNKHTQTEMKINVTSAQVAMAAVLGLTFAEGQTTQEVELTSENIVALSTALETATSGLATANADLAKKTTEVESKTTKVTELEAEIEKLGKQAGQVGKPVAIVSESEAMLAKEKKESVSITPDKVQSEINNDY